MTRRPAAALARVLTVLLGLGLFVSGLPAQADGASSSTSRSAKVRKGGTTATKRTPSKKRVRSSRGKRYSGPRARARRARLARAMAAQRARELRELATPRFKVGADGTVVPDVRAAAAVIYNPVTHEILWEENGETSRSIASITKVMTAIVLFEHETDPSREVQIEASDVRGANHTYLRANERLRVDDLLNLLLVASDNAAARALARTSALGADGFVAQMNQKASELGLSQTEYTDPSGLHAGNVSSARDMAQLIAYAAADERIAAIMRKSEHQLTTSRRTLTVHNTNRLVGTDIDVLGGKTGFIRNAGYCLATMLRLPQTNQQVAVVVLGARSNAGRFMETRHLFNWVTGKAQQLLGATPEPPVPVSPQPEN